MEAVPSSETERLSMVTTSIEQLPLESDSSSRHLPLGPGLVVSCPGSAVLCANLVSLTVRARLVGPASAVELMQSFQIPAGEPQEFFYLFPLPSAACVTRFRVQLGQRVCEWQVTSREQVAQLEKTPLPGFLGTLFQDEFQQVFCVPLGALSPGEQVNIDLAYAELLGSSGGECRFNFPLMTSARLQTGASLDEDLSQPAPVSLAPGLASGANFALSVVLDVAGGPPIRVASSHGLVTHQLQSGELGFELARQELAPRNFVFSYRLGQEKNPQGTLHIGRQHFLYHLNPPVVGPPTTSPRHLIILMDVSDSAQGKRLEQSKRIAGQLLQSIGPGELFSLVAFNHELQGYEQGTPNDKSHVALAVNWLQGLRASGRVDMRHLLENILKLVPDTGHSTSVILLACGKLGNEPELFATLTAYPTPIRFQCIGLGNKVNHSFLRRVSGVTRGVSTFLGTEPLDEATQARLIADTRGSLLVDLQLIDQGLGVNAETFTPAPPPGLPQFESLSILGLKAANGGIEARARTFSGHAWSESATAVPTQNPALGLIWAHHKAREMADELKLISGPRASRLREVSGNLARDYRLVSETTASILTDASAPGGALLLPSLYPHDWKPEVVVDLTKSRRLQPPPPIEDLPPRQADPTLEEPSSPRAAPVDPADDPSRSHSGLTAKAAILSTKSKLSREMKSEAQTKPMMGSGKLSRVTGGKPMTTGKPVLRQEARTAAKQVPEVVEPQARRLPQPNRKVEPEVVEPVAAPPVAPPPAQPEPVVQQQPPPPPSVETAPPPPSAETDPEQALARQLLGSNPAFRQAMMVDLKAIYQTLARCAQTNTQSDPQLLALLEKVLRALQPLMGQSTLLKEAYRIGVLCYQAVRGGQDPQALAKTQHWVQRFAKLF